MTSLKALHVFPGKRHGDMLVMNNVIEFKWMPGLTLEGLVSSF